MLSLVQTEGRAHVSQIELCCSAGEGCKVARRRALLSDEISDASGSIVVSGNANSRAATSGNSDR
jgi:hypothetical protein